MSDHPTDCGGPTGCTGYPGEVVITADYQYVVTAHVIQIKLCGEWFTAQTAYPEDGLQLSAVDMIAQKFKDASDDVRISGRDARGVEMWYQIV